MGGMGICFLRTLPFNSEVMGERRHTAEAAAFYASILPSLLKNTAKSHFVIEASTFLSRKQQNLLGCL